MKASRLNIILSVFTCIIFTTACDTKEDNRLLDKEDEDLEYITEKSEGYNFDAVNYLFFNEEEGSKIVTLTLNTDYSHLPLVAASLYQDDELVSSSVRIIDTSIHDLGQFTIKLEEYISAFNKIQVVTNQNQIIMIKTGQYEFEKVNIINSVPISSRWSIESFNTVEKGTNFTFLARYSREVTDEWTYEILLPQGSIEKLEIEVTNSKQERDNILDLNIEITTLKSLLHGASYEALVIQKNMNDEIYLMNTIINSIEPGL